MNVAGRACQGGLLQVHSYILIGDFNVNPRKSDAICSAVGAGHVFDVVSDHGLAASTFSNHAFVVLGLVVCMINLDFNVRIYASIGGKALRSHKLLC